MDIDVNSTIEYDNPTSSDNTDLLSILDANKCPICHEILRNPHITLCGHTFCYRCISFYIKEKSMCAVCSTSINSQDGDRFIIPNLGMASLIQSLSKQQTCSSLFTDSEAGRKNLVDSLFHLGAERIDKIIIALKEQRSIIDYKNKLKNNIFLLEFLNRLIEQREPQIQRLQAELIMLKGDRDIIIAELQKEHNISCKGGDVSERFVDKKLILNEDLQIFRKRLNDNISDLSGFYIDKCSSAREGGLQDRLALRNEILDSMSNIIHGIVQFGEFKRIASVNLNEADSSKHSIVTSIDFDKEGLYFAMCGVEDYIEIYDFNSIIDASEVLTDHIPLAILPPVKKTSCVAWNNYAQNLLAASDYDGEINVWDVNTKSIFGTYQEHCKRCWSVHFNVLHPHIFASASDDAQVNIWTLNMKNSIARIYAKMNVCSVQFSPVSSYDLAFGAADHCIYLYDFRNTRSAVNTLRGHQRQVSHVKYLTGNELISASIDGTIRQWNVVSGQCTGKMSGHKNFRHFTGLASNGRHIACGSENSEVVLYHKSLRSPMMCYNVNPSSGGSPFVSSLCWKKDSNFIVAGDNHSKATILQLQ